MTGKRKTGAPRGNTRALKHGGEAAVDAIEHGRPFAGMAAQMEQGVEAELEAGGRAELVKEGAIRLHTAARLYWAAVQTAADTGDLEKLDAFCARFGWLMGASLRAWEQVRKEGGDSDQGVVLDALKAAEDPTDGENADTD